MNGNRGATILGFAVAILILLAVFWFIGLDAVIDALAQARLSVVALIVLVALLWLSAWGMALYTVLGALEVPIRARKAITVFTAVVFSNNVTPFGQAGGEPLSALLISRATDSEYETGLAAVASVDALHFVPSIGLATLGISFIAISTGSVDRRLQVASLAVAGLALAIPIAVYVGWRYRYELESVVVRAFTPLIRGVGRLIPGSDPLDPALIKRRIEAFFSAIDRVADDRQTIVLALGFSLVGWVLLSTSLWLSVWALGPTVSFAAALVVIPVGAIAGFTPLPGGLVGVEGAFIVLLVSTTGIALPVASAAVVLHRGATYWLPTVIGGGTAAVIGTKSRMLPRRDEE
jgi:uncharacterized protein (TIRG00374 family)